MHISEIVILFALAIVCAVAAGVAIALVLRRHIASRASDGSALLDPAEELNTARSELKTEREGRAEAEKQLATAVEAKRLQDVSILDLKERLDALALKKGEEIAAAMAQWNGTRVELATAQSELAVARKTIELERNQTADKLKLLDEAREQMKKEFQLLANQAMAKHGEEFKKTNLEQMDGILNPLRERLAEFQKGLHDAQLEAVKERASLGQQIKNLADTSLTMAAETLNLTKALKGTTKMQGAWGEMILETLLEQSGLREGHEYLTQQSHTNEEGERFRPDVTVKLPEGGRHVIIDSKVSLVAFEAYVNAETDEERERQLVAHIASLRAHIRRLGNKEYHSASAEGLDYVIMFIPIEGALSAAVQAEPALIHLALQCNVMVATPNVLMIALRTIEHFWQIDRRNQNAAAIAERAGRLYDKFVGFIEDMTSLGGRLAQAQTTYHNAMGKLGSGSGNLVTQVEKLKRLGARTSKALPPGMVDDEDDEIAALAAPDTPGLIVGSLQQSSEADPLAGDL